MEDQKYAAQIAGRRLIFQPRQMHILYALVAAKKELTVAELAEPTRSPIPDLCLTVNTVYEDINFINQNVRTYTSMPRLIKPVRRGGPIADRPYTLVKAEAMMLHMDGLYANLPRPHNV